jgi:hypothetical protein
MRKLLIIVLLVLTGCSAVGNVIPINSNTYTVTASGNYKSWADLKTEGIQAASEFCKKQNKQIDIVGWDTHGVRGWSPQEAELTFKCSSDSTQKP